MKVLYFDCFCGADIFKLLGALADVYGLEKTCELAEKFNSKKVKFTGKNTIISGIPGCLADIETDNDYTITCEECKKILDNVTFDKNALELAEKILNKSDCLTVRKVYAIVLSCAIFYALNAQNVVSSPVCNGMESNDEKNRQKIFKAFKDLNVAYKMCDDVPFITTIEGISFIAHVCQNYGPMPDIDIEKIGYGLGGKTEGCSNALRIVIGNSKMGNVADLFEASLEFESVCFLNMT